MAISIYNIKKWWKMVRGKSSLHVNQGEGKIYSVEKVEGYYNDLTEKVTKYGLLDTQLPVLKTEKNESILFSIGIFQYGLGAYDEYLITKDENMLKKAVACADWAVENQDGDGAWLTFDFSDKENPYSSMAQGEGVSLLLRIYLLTKNEVYFTSAKKAIDFMLKPIDEGGTARYDGEDVFFYEYTNKPLVLNGWIFSIWGLLDFCKVSNLKEYCEIYKKAIRTLSNKLESFSLKYWSKYNVDRAIASKFYHNLHVAQLKVLYNLVGDEIFLNCALKWERYAKSFFKSKRAFIKKAFQKIFERKD